MVDLQGQAVVAVLTRAPSAGGKSRLFAALGRAPEPELLAALFLDTLDAVRVPGITRVVCFTPPEAEAEMDALVDAGVLLVPQRGSDLGQRMRNAFEDLLGAQARAVVLVGSDLPLLDSCVIVEAHEVLRTRPDALVIGPAADGGYYLIGASRVPAVVFDGMTWSHADVLRDTEQRAYEAGLATYRVATAADVDSIADLRRVLAHAGAHGARTRRAMLRLGVK